MIPHVKPYYGSKEIEAVSKYLQSDGYLTEYKVTEEFENKLAEFLQVPYVSLVPSGTVALYLSLLASGLSKGSIIAIPDLTMIATYNAVLAAGMYPELVDVDTEGCMNIKDISAMPNGLIYVELNGRASNLFKVKKYCQKNGIVFIEDSCQALGSQYEGKYLGTFGRFGCFSLGFHKIITTGQGGFIVTRNKKDYEAVERLKDHGRLQGGNDIHDYFGLNFKFTDLQASFGLEQLKTIKWRMQKKRQLYEWYFGAEADEGYVPWFIEWWDDNTTDLQQRLKKSSIESRKMYPPLHSQKFIDYPGNFPESVRRSNLVLWVPSSLSLTKQEVDYINETV